MLHRSSQPYRPASDTNTMRDQLSTMLPSHDGETGITYWVVVAEIFDPATGAVYHDVWTPDAHRPGSDVDRLLECGRRALADPDIGVNAA